MQNNFNYRAFLVSLTLYLHTVMCMTLKSTFKEWGGIFKMLKGKFIEIGSFEILKKNLYSMNKNLIKIYFCGRRGWERKGI